MSNTAQKKAAAAFDNTKTAKSITTAKRGLFIAAIVLAGALIVWYFGNGEASSTAYRLSNEWYTDDDYRELVPMIRSALDDGVLRQTEWWSIASRQEEIEKTRQRNELLKQ